ncbi:MAG: endo alpha-1,4 polygalactosaminidase [Verrucomicrobiae bacterium]|nr:endo alpha-1,4 polygalactosaminidase [Verrucomicrobiae bacterium]
MLSRLYPLIIPALSTSAVLLISGCATTESASSGGAGADGTPTWSIQYQGAIQVRNKTYHVVDLYDVSDSDLARIRAAGSKPIAYFSSQYEEWRPDASQFPDRDLGNPLLGWPGERWVNTKSEAIRSIIRSRLDLAKRRGFYGVDVDNTDLYEHITGFENSTRTAANYVRFIATEAHARGLKYSLKNSMDLIPAVKNVVDFYQNEECQQYGEEDRYRGVGPVFNIEYKRPSSPYRRKGFYSLLKRTKMGAFEEEL